MKQLARLCQNNATPVTIEKLDTEFLFERLDLPAQHRLRHRQHRARARERAEFGKRCESLELLEIHPDPSTWTRPIPTVST
ncbi:hypothetical protein GALL_459260 [mine drainage metagenome]|uniref:Uncharacterized protein n=1 Tax=mine drainage metagenome TaxID=410659 RepID=A0A1J5PMS2_9ZZZZ